MEHFIADLLNNVSNFQEIPRKITIMFQIYHILLISFPILSKVPLYLANVYRPNRNYIHPCGKSLPSISLCQNQHHQIASVNIKIPEN